MKRPMVYLSAAAVAAAPLMVTEPADAVPRHDGRGNDIQSFCRELVASGAAPWLSMGECVSLNISSDTEKGGFVAHTCDSWRDLDELELAGFTSYAECIRRFTP